MVVGCGMWDMVPAVRVGGVWMGDWGRGEGEVKVRGFEVWGRRGKWEVGRWKWEVEVNFMRGVWYAMTGLWTFWVAFWVFDWFWPGGGDELSCCVYGYCL